MKGGAVSFASEPLASVARDSYNTRSVASHLLPPVEVSGVLLKKTSF